MFKVALTGSFHSGHDDVQHLFRKLKVKVFDADLMLRYLVNFSPTHVEKITKSFGSKIYTLGTINLDLIRKSVDLEHLVDLVEFDILLAYAKFRLKNKEDSYTVFKYSFLFERELETDFDYTINTYRPKNLRKSDMLDLTKIPSISISKILDGEYNPSSKNMSSNFVITNSSTSHNDLEILKPQVIKVHDILTKKIPQDFLGV